MKQQQQQTTGDVTTIDAYLDEQVKRYLQLKFKQVQRHFYWSNFGEKWHRPTLDKNQTF